MQIRGIEDMSVPEIRAEIREGGRFVFFEWCVSILVVTYRRPSSIYFLRRRQNGVMQSLPFTLLTLVFGWWGIPWGMIYTPKAIFTNLSGGRDVSQEVLAFFSALESVSEDSTGFPNDQENP